MANTSSATFTLTPMEEALVHIAEIIANKREDEKGVHMPLNVHIGDEDSATGSLASRSPPINCPVSAAAKDRIMALYRPVIARVTQPDCPSEPSSLMISLHVQVLFARGRWEQDQYALVAAMDEVDEAPWESLTPELQQVREWFDSGPKLPFAPRIVERRINEALRANGEGELRMPFVDDFLDRKRDPPRRTKKSPQQLERERRQLTVRLKDLKRRKPQLHTTITNLIEEFNFHKTSELMESMARAFIESRR